MPVHQHTGDATRPHLDHRHGLLAHICNDAGRWGRGFVVALSARWDAPEAAYRRWASAAHPDVPLALGTIQPVAVTGQLTVVNMVAQHGTRPGADGTPPIRYDALATCLTKLARYADQRDATIHLPRIGAGLAGGNWPHIRQLIDHHLTARHRDVHLYTLPATS